MFSKGLAAIIFAAVLAFPAGAIMAQGGGADVSGSSDLLGTVVVSASRTAERLREVSSNITVISGEDVELAPADDLSELLKQQGFAMIDYGASTVLQIRGIYRSVNVQTGSIILVLVNGRRTGITDVKQVPLDNIERIEIIRGPAAVQYGSAAMGGVINVITKRRKEDGISLALETGIGSWNLNKSSMSINGMYNDFDFSVAASYMDRGSFSVKGDVEFPHTSTEQKNIMVELGYTFAEKHRIGVHASKNELNNEWPTIGFREIPVLQPPGTPFTSYNTFNFSETTWGITYDGATPGGDFDWSAFYSKSKYKRVPYYSDGSTDFITQDIDNYGAALGYNSSYVDIDLGFDFIRYKIKANYEGDNVFKDFGLYLNSKIKLFDDKLFVSLGARFDEASFRSRAADGLSKSENNFATSFGVSYLPAEWIKIRANYSQGFRMPTAYEYLGGTSYWFTYPITYLPNPDLKPERSKTFEFGFDIDYLFFSSSVTYFTTVWKDRIHSMGVAGGYQALNLKKTETAGFEIALKADLGEAFDLGFEISPYVNFTYLTKRKNRDEYYIRTSGYVDTMPAIPHWTLSYGVTVRHPGIDLMVNANAAHTGPTYFWNYNNITGGRDPIWRGSEMVALDLAIEKGLWEIGQNGQYGKLKLRVEAKNLLDSKNEVYYDYPGPGRNFYVGLKYEY
ncbi:MAG: TonB-dependent receptor [Deltaproteobacteria bacterium]|jgi:vitamin B12 transporter|nr:TonB-dependent receptor [Deltaproteobacteria bacterium]